MESSHVGPNLEELREEQESIDKLIDSLLNSTSTPASNSLQQRSERENPSTPVVGRGRGPGRPRTAKPASSRPPSSPSPALAENSSLAAVIQCLNKLNVQNKRLLDFVEVVSENVNKCAPNSNSTPEPNGSPAEEDGVVAAQQQQSITNVNDRLEKIEQNININTLVCRGTAVDDLINTTRIAKPPTAEG